MAMKEGLIGRKRGMTQVFGDDGSMIPVTVVEAGPCTVVAVRTPERGTVIQPTDVKMAAWGGPELPKGAYTSVEQVGGLTVIDPVQQNEAVLTSRLASPAGGGAGPRHAPPRQGGPLILRVKP